MSTSLRYTSADLETLPAIEGVRYELIDGDLYVSMPPHYRHQRVSGRAFLALELWSRQSELGEPNLAPGLIFAPEQTVAPDVIWTSYARLQARLDESGHLHVAPELVVEVLSYGATNEQRDREVKLKLYSRQGVQEYWIVDWQLQMVQIYRRQRAVLRLVATLGSQDDLTSSLLPSFRCPVSDLWK
jgi:Uma2 family endonuclease